jgi:predicted SprT family Zn-dependent metalloprotease
LWHNVLTMDIRIAEKLAKNLLNQHGLGSTWRFEFDSARSRFGSCFYSKNLITLSKALVAVNEEAEVRDTILHEIAHALAGGKAKHGLAWKIQCIKIGARPERCYSTTNVATVTTEWRAECPRCGEVQTVKMRRRPQDYSCLGCFKAGRAEAAARGGGFNIGDYNVRWTKVADVVVVPKNKQWPHVPLHESVTHVPVVAQPVAVRSFDAAEAIRLYQSGLSVPDIAVRFGYRRNQGNNRIRTALMKAGVYKTVPVDFQAAK